MAAVCCGAETAETGETVETAEAPETGETAEARDPSAQRCGEKSQRKRTISDRVVGALPSNAGAFTAFIPSGSDGAGGGEKRDQPGASRQSRSGIDRDQRSSGAFENGSCGQHSRSQEKDFQCAAASAKVRQDCAPVARELRPTLLDDIGIIPAFRVYIKDFTKHTRIPVHFDCVGSVEQVNPARRTALYRVAQEALGNVAQHAQASRVTMNLRKVRNAVRMTIKDNGKSFQVERVILGHKNRSLGLLGMRERIEMVGGNFKIDSVRGKGTTVQARVPLK